jgi:ferredoxin
VLGYFFSLGGSDMFSLVLAVGMVIDLPIRKSCSSGQCSAPAVQVEKKVEKSIKIETVKTDTKVFRGGKLRFSLRGSSCCGR